ncbi:TIGR02677 family protein [Metabacillus arenae]|uniref:TIGR02677 family protein n=1 Tax=Metabacillus arenae TaxID=2771434 RepID=A0A926NKI6_9BACI|nr:TIGR02677 family protein [Metabacillus arenae]MBD1379521.1 TIGR02677 family protein [Metabacillus arenae]
MDEKLFKPITEATYLTTENAWRYRTILRYFYEQHERMRQYLFPEEVIEYLNTFEAFQSYTEEMLQHDLEQLVKWKNLIARQETGKVKTIEEFKKKRFRYQCSPYTVEIERMVKSLEKLGDSFGGSLERTLFERLYETLRKCNTLITQTQEPSDEEVFRVWEDVFDYFRKLIQNSADYIAYINSENIEERMMTEAFLAYKDAFTEYLRDFIISLQQTSLNIEFLLQNMDQDLLKKMIGKVIKHQLKIPRLEDVALDPKRLMEEHLQSWDSLKTWFLGKDGHLSELEMLQDKTNETIRRMTRFAQRLGEKHHNLRSRKTDYLHLAGWFSTFDELDEAHKLSSVVFGVFHTKHIFAGVKKSEDIYVDIWDEVPTTLSVKPRIRQYREKTKPSALADHKLEKEMMLNEYLTKKEQEQKILQQLMTGNKIIFNELPEIEGSTRKTLLAWLGKALGNKNQIAKIETGKKIKVVRVDSSTITLRSKDGELQMPNFEIEFLDKE